MKKIPMFALAIMGLVLVAGLASAFQGSGEPEQMRLADEETRLALDKAFETDDYDAWYEIVSEKPKITDYITEENFEVYADMHEAVMNGDMESAKELRQALGLPGFRQGQGKLRQGLKNKAHGCDCQFESVN